MVFIKSILYKERPLRPHSPYTKEIVGVLVIKLVLIIVIKQVWFTDRPPVNGDT
ncbi:cytochrome oxidase putative small subunit CydP, partial [Paludibacterium yongneupense]